MSDENKEMGGIFGGLKKLLFTDEYLENNQNTAPVETKKEVENTATNTVIVAPIPKNITDEMVQKLMQLLETMNKPGIDFFELWNAAEAMGGSTPQNLQNAFTSFKILGLTKENAISTGAAYQQELREKLNLDINQKTSEKNNIIAKLETEKKSLSEEKSMLEKQIAELQNRLSTCVSKLGTIEAEYAKPLSDIDLKINSGKAALDNVLGKINSVLEIIKNNIN